MRARAWWAWGLVLLSSCAPEFTQAGQLPQLTVLPVAMPEIGALDFEVAGGRLSGSLSVEAASRTPQPIRVALVWTDSDGAGVRPLLDAEQQPLGTFDGSEVYRFDVALASPSGAISNSFERPCGTSARARAAVVVYVDVNHSGHLEISQQVDHVLASSDFPYEELLRAQVTTALVTFDMTCSVGTFGALQGRLPLFDSRALDLATCPVGDRYLLYSSSCGIFPRPPEMHFYGNLYGDVAKVGLTTSSPTTVLIDGVPRGTGTPSIGFQVRDAALSIGQHHLRAETDGLPWEATFTFPDRTWLRGLYRVDDGFELHFQEIEAAENYALFVEQRMAVTGAKSPLRFAHPGPGEFLITLSARFAGLPFGAHASETFTFEL